MVGVGILIVHLTAQFHPPFGHGKGEPDIKPDSHRNDHQIPNVKQHREDHRDQRQLQDQRADREQQETQQELHAFYATLDDAAQPAGLARDVIAHGQAVDMAEGLQCQTAQRPLSHRGKDRITQLLKAGREDPRHPVGDSQPHRPKRQRRYAFTGQAVDSALVQHGRIDCDHLGQHQNCQRRHHAVFHPGLILGPEIGPNLAQGPQTGSAFILRRCLVSVSHHMSLFQDL